MVNLQSLRMIYTIVVLLAAASCTTRSGTPRVAPTPTEREKVTVERTGGFAGVADHTAIQPGGDWTHTDREGNRRSGRLTPAEQRELDRLLADPGLQDTARPQPTESICNDAFDYRLTIGSMTISYTDCPEDAKPPAAAVAVVAFIESATST
ncbi:MAG TPA: hypothetical protein VFX61_02595 [Micromonosporaceae bacterium]|nr:hypothetical protein [Micromonosporaceae bacterium]